MALLILSACAQVEIKDEELYGDFGDDGATMVHTQKPDTRDIPKDEWDEMRFGMICVKSKAIADWKEELEQLCSLTTRCTYEQKKMLAEIWAKIERFNKRASR